MMPNTSPTTTSRSGGPSSPTAHDQHESPIFGKLPPELRAIIFTELFGGRRLHLEFMPHPSRSDKAGNRRRWRHGVCEDSVDTSFDRVIGRSHYCLTAARRRVLDISIIFTCRRALMEGLSVLYQRNTFLIINTGSRRRPVDDIRSLQAKIPKHWPLIQSLEIKWEVAAFDRNQASMVPHLWGRDAYEAFWDALAEMPHLAHLRVALLMPRLSALEPNAPPVELQDLYLKPILRLKHLRSCEVAMLRSYHPIFGDGEWDSFMARRGKDGYHISWVDDDPGRVPPGPAVANIHHLLTASTHRFKA